MSNLKPIPWVGGKQGIITLLNKMIPFHNIYIEIFGGGASLLFYKKKSYIEVYNDINDKLVNFFEILRDKPEEFYNKLTLTPIARSRFNYENEVQDKVLQAVYFYLRIKYSYYNKGKSWEGVNIGARKNMKKISKEEIDKFSNRVKDVIIENKDYKFILKRYDRADAFFYIDPPYIDTTRELYIKTIKQEELAAEIKKLKGKFLLNNYESDVIKKLYKGYNYKVINNQTGLLNKNEVIIWNY